MSIEKAREYLSRFGEENNILEFAQSSATVALAAKAVGCAEGQIAKSLSFLVKGEPILVVCAGDVKIDNSKYKAAFGAKASMIGFDDVERLIGHAVGGVCPFGVADGVKVYLDESLKAYDFVYPACGSSNSAIKLTIDKLEAYSNAAAWVDVCKSAEV